MKDLTASLNPMQKEAVLKTEGPLLLLAGAGSGKTRVLTHRIAYLIQQGVKPYNIMAITFTNKAAKEMKERVEKITPFGKDVWVSTFHSSCVRILRRDIEKIGYTSKFTIYDADDSEKLIKEVIKDLNINEKNFQPRAVMSEISNQKNELISAVAYKEMAGEDYYAKVVSKIYYEYQKRLKQNNALDFDDIILKTVQLFAQNPDVLDKYREKFKYIMVDEYQDTNTCQYNLIRQLSSKHRNLCVVGDDDQSIYGWRGANIRNILDFEKDFKNATVIKLEQNYRSTQTILDAANSVIGNNFNRKSKSLWTDNEKGEAIKIKRLENDIDEALFIVSEIERGIKAGRDYKDFAILYRNNALSRIIEDRLVKNSIPYRLLGGVPFYTRREIKDIMCYLKALYNPLDDIAIKRIINVPKRGIGNATVEKLSIYAMQNDMSIFEAILNVSEIPDLKTRSKKLLEFSKLILDLQEDALNLNISTLIETIMEKTEYKESLLKEGDEDVQDRFKNLGELISKATEFEETNEKTDLTAFLEEVALVADVDNYSENDDTVVLMTLHSSKGLEFPVVFIAGFEEGIFPSYRSTLDSSPSAIEEERRLCYVGITRAKTKLYLTLAKSRLQYGQYTYNAPSRFIKELPKEYIQVEQVNKGVVKTEVSNKITNEKPLARQKYNPQKNKNYSSYNALLSPKNVTLDFEVGDKVKQIKYGVGVVTNIAPAGADYEITVEFPEVGAKKFMAKLCRFKKLQ